MLSETLDSLLEALQLAPDPKQPSHLLLARHAAESYRFFQRSVDVFEEYQRFQTDDNFAKCKFVLAFLGLPGRGLDATFGGVYEVLGRTRRGESGFREPQGDPEVVESCSGQNYLYSLARLTQYDSLRGEWDIRWNLPGPAKYQYFKPRIPIATLRLGNAADAQSMISRARQELVISNSECTEDPDSASFVEGASSYERHVKHERSAALVSFVKQQARMRGSYHCFVCSFDFQRTYGIDYLECHHTIPIRDMKLGDSTKPDDCVLLCANCHRAVHKHKTWLSKTELKRVLLDDSALEA